MTNDFVFAERTGCAHQAQDGVCIQSRQVCLRTQGFCGIDCW